jgi:hypothetical protein
VADRGGDPGLPRRRCLGVRIGCGGLLSGGARNERVHLLHRAPHDP